jgi:hypothetical protein
MEAVNCMSHTNHLTRKLMEFKKTPIIVGVLAATLLILPALAGCDGVQERKLWYGATDNGKTQETESQSKEDGGLTKVIDEEEPQTPAAVENVRYEIPDGWRWSDEKKLNPVKGDDDLPHMGGVGSKLEFAGVWEGGGETAKAHAKEKYESYKQGCIQAGSYCEDMPEYDEIAALGTIVYCVYDAGGYAGLWTSHCEFAKNGKVVRFMFYDRADTEKALLEKMASTITWDMKE